MEENPSELVASNQQNQNQNSVHYVNCNICQRVFKTNRGLLQHLSFCRKRNRENTINSNAINDNNNAAVISGKSDNHDYIGNGDYETYIWNDVPRDNIDDEITVETTSNLSPYLPRISINKTHTNPEDHLWGNVSFDSLSSNIDQIYDEITRCHKNLFKVPTGQCGKLFIDELTFWLHQFNENTKLNQISLKCFMILPALILQKPSKQSKAKDHKQCVTRRMQLWKEGNICEIMREVRCIQRKITTSKKQRTAEDISKTFAKLMMQGKVSVALKYLHNKSSSVMTCTDSVLNELREKQPPEAPIKEGSLLFGPINFIPECFFGEIDETSIFNSALRTKGAAGPSGMDSELYRRILCSKWFGSSCKSLREEIAKFTKNNATKSYHPDLLQAYVSSRLIPLDKNPGSDPLGLEKYYA